MTLAALGASCSSDAEHGGLATSCVLNSDCNSPLACTFGRCHTECRLTADCPRGQRCVSSGAAKVCQLPEESSCAAASCPAPLQCAADGQCRNDCSEGESACTQGQVCTVDGACAEHNEVDGAGRLVNAAVDGGPGGNGGSGGAPNGPEGGPPSGGAIGSGGDGTGAERGSGGTPGNGGSGGMPGGCGMNVSSDTACEAALDASCCAEEVACAADTGCTDRLSCSVDCGGYPDCVDVCSLSYNTNLTTLFGCLSHVGGACALPVHSVSLAVTGLTKSFSVMVNGDSASTQVIAADGSYDFGQLAEGDVYAMSVVQGTGDHCTFRMPVGVVGKTDVVVRADCGPDRALPGVEGYSTEGNSAWRLADGSLMGGSNGGNYSVYLFKATPSNTLDATFGTGGLLTLYTGNSSTTVTALQPGPSGTLLGVTRGTGSYGGPIMVYRWASDGQPDTTFGANGQTTLDWYSGIGYSAPVGGVVDAAGRIAVGARIYNGAANQAGVVRFDATGAPDTTFGTNGKKLLPSTFGDVGGLALQGDKIVVFGGGNVNCTDPSQDCNVMIRVDSKGAIDSTFSSADATAAFTSIASVIALADGSLVVSGMAARRVFDFTGAARVLSIVAKLDPDGHLVASRRSAPVPFLMVAPLIAVDSASGKLVIAQTEQAGSRPPVSFSYVARLNPDLTYDATFGEGGAITFGHHGGSGAFSTRVVGIVADPGGVARVVSNGGDGTTPGVVIDAFP